jgi:hypothetical protein
VDACLPEVFAGQNGQIPQRWEVPKAQCKVPKKTDMRENTTGEAIKAKPETDIGQDSLD